MFELFLIIDIIMAVAAILSGYYMRFRASKDETMKHGLRISGSLKSREAWEFANISCGRSWMAVGVIEICLGMPIALLMYWWKGRSIAIALLFVYLEFFTILLCVSVINVSRNISDKFDENGRPIKKGVKHDQDRS